MFDVKTYIIEVNVYIMLNVSYHKLFLKKGNGTSLQLKVANTLCDHHRGRPKPGHEAEKEINIFKLIGQSQSHSPRATFR